MKTINYIKIFKTPFLVFLIMLTSACELEEVAPFLDKTVYENPQTAQASAKGIYAGLTAYDAKERGVFVINGFSGLFVEVVRGFLKFRIYSSSELTFFSKRINASDSPPLK